MSPEHTQPRCPLDLPMAGRRWNFFLHTHRIFPASSRHFPSQHTSNIHDTLASTFRNIPRAQQLMCVRHPIHTVCSALASCTGQCHKWRLLHPHPLVTVCGDVCISTAQERGQTWYSVGTDTKNACGNHTEGYPVQRAYVALLFRKPSRAASMLVAPHSVLPEGHSHCTKISTLNPANHRPRTIKAPGCLSDHAPCCSGPRRPYRHQAPSTSSTELPQLSLCARRPGPLLLFLSSTCSLLSVHTVLPAVCYGLWLLPTCKYTRKAARPSCISCFDHMHSTCQEVCTGRSQPQAFAMTVADMQIK